MEKQQLEDLLQKYEEWNKHGLPCRQQIKNWVTGEDYDLVSAELQEYWNIYPRNHYHYESKLYLIYKPKFKVSGISSINYGDVHPNSTEETYTNMSLQEQEKKVITRYNWNWHNGEKGDKIKEFRWVATIKQGQKEPEYKIEEIKT